MANGKVGPPEGNTNGSKKNKIVGDTLRRVAAQNPDKLRKACEKLLNKAVAGDAQAFKEIRDTLDGKPAQLIEGSGVSGEIILRITKPDESIL